MLWLNNWKYINFVKVSRKTVETVCCIYITYIGDEMVQWACSNGIAIRIYLNSANIQEGFPAIKFVPQQQRTHKTNNKKNINKGNAQMYADAG